MPGVKTIALVRDLADALRAEGVRYCHFKSNAFLDRSRTAENDLDLLVDRSHAQPFAAILHRLGFKHAHRLWRPLPGVLDYYGYDAGADRIVHVHVHYQLIVGDDLTKNYCLPLESAFLDGAVLDGELRVAPPELELILLVLRMVIKHVTWDAVALRRRGVPASAHAELAWLQQRADPALRATALARLLPTVDEETFQLCRRAIEPAGGRVTGLRAGRRLVVALAPFARRSRPADLALKVARRAEGTVRSRVPGLGVPSKRLQAGGGLIALVGADGAGKTTAIDALEGWLGRNFAVTRVHLGRPPMSQARRALTNAARARSLGRRLTGRRAPARSTEQAVLAVALARDRYRTFCRARRIAANGGLVLSDRFPLAQLPTMDAPRVERLRHPRRFARLGRALATVERGYYDRITRPDLLLVLRVDPEVAVARKPGESATANRARWAEIWAVDWSTVPAAIVDAGAPVDDVHARLKALVWPAI